MKIIKRIVQIILLLLVIAIIGGLIFAYTMLAVNEKNVDPQNIVAPDLLQTAPGTTITTVDEWEATKDTVLAQMQEIQYGEVPTKEVAWNVEKETLDILYDGKAVLEQWLVTAPEGGVSFTMVVLLPQSEEPVAALAGSNFCPHHVRFDYELPTPDTYPSFCDATSVIMSAVKNRFFGEYIDTFPFKTFVDKNIAFASIYLGELAADDAMVAQDDLLALRDLTNSNVDGVLAAWAYGFIESVRLLETDDRIDAARTGVYGHSRDGKAALLAGAVSDRIDLVLSHQSGKGGASLWQRGVGESIKNVTNTYSHWFTPTFADYIDKESQLPIDQHQLLATLAPRPVLLSTAWMDKWSDPAGTLRAAHEATKVYELYGARGTESVQLSDYAPEHELAFFIRSETHGVRAVDWDAFFLFLEAHF